MVLSGTVVGMRRVRSLAVLVLAVSWSNSSYALPDRTEGQTRAAEDYLAQVVSDSRGGDACDVRLPGELDGSSFVWAECLGSSGGISTPMVVDSDDVELAGDGGHYSEDVRRSFPAEIADAILTDVERLKP